MEINKSINDDKSQEAFDLQSIPQFIPASSPLPPSSPPLPPSSHQTEKTKGFNTESSFMLKIRNYDEQKAYITKWAEITFECLNEHKDKLKSAHIRINVDGNISTYYEWNND